VRRSESTIRHIQLFGQRCSGTHAIARTIEANFGLDARTEAYGFKHWFVPDQVLFRDDVLVLVIARNVFDWLRSLHRQPWHAHPGLKGLSFSEFIRTPWHSYWDDQFWGIDKDHPLRGQEMMHERDRETGRQFADPIAKRTAKLRHWSELHLRAHNVALLSHGALEADPISIVNALATASGLPLVGRPQSVLSYKGNGNRTYVPTSYDAISNEDMAWISSRIDAEVESRFFLQTT
jgi:hypothetical protein